MTWPLGGGVFWVGAGGRRGWGRRGGGLAVGQGLHELGREPGGERRHEPEERQHDGRDQQPIASPLLQPFLPNRRSKAAHRADPGPTNRRTTSSNEGRTSSNRSSSRRSSRAHRRSSCFAVSTSVTTIRAR